MFGPSLARDERPVLRTEAQRASTSCSEAQGYLPPAIDIGLRRLVPAQTDSRKAHVDFLARHLRVVGN